MPRKFFTLNLASNFVSSVEDGSKVIQCPQAQAGYIVAEDADSCLRLLRSISSIAGIQAPLEEDVYACGCAQ